MNIEKPIHLLNDSGSTPYEEVLGLEAGFHCKGALECYEYSMKALMRAARISAVAAKNTSKLGTKLKFFRTHEKLTNALNIMRLEYHSFQHAVDVLRNDIGEENES